jgi:hypothetical protein
MADVLVRHPRNPSKIVKFTINVRQLHDVTYDPNEVLLVDQPRVEGDEIWILEIGTYETDINGDPIPERKIKLVSLSNLSAIIDETIRDMCSYVDWGTLQTDREAPYVYWYMPNDGTLDLETPAIVEDASLSSDIYFKLREDFPAVGIDLSSIEVSITISGTDPTKEWTIDEDITSEVEITGTPYDAQIYWSPPVRIKEEF